MYYYDFVQKHLISTISYFTGTQYGHASSRPLPEKLKETDKQRLKRLQLEYWIQKGAVFVYGPPRPDLVVKLTGLWPTSDASRPLHEGGDWWHTYPSMLGKVPIADGEFLIQQHLEMLDYGPNVPVLVIEGEPWLWPHTPFDWDEVV